MQRLSGSGRSAPVERIEMYDLSRVGFRSRLRQIVAALIAGAALAGCAGLPAGVEPPTVTISDFGIGSASLFEQQFNLKLRIQNPNPQELRIDGVAFDLEINDQPFATGVGNQAVTVPRFGSAFMPVEAVSSLGGLLRQFGALVLGDKPGFRYRIKGSLSLAGGTRIPFDRRGEFDLGAVAPR
jgi:LEA14-like dessication related protein